jgi:hypothetical protein
MRLSVPVLTALALAFLVPAASAHGGLTLNEFDVYAIGDFEGHEDSFEWEGFEIWDVYAGDGYSMQNESHGVYFKVNLAGDGTKRPSGGETWDIQFTYKVGGTEYTRIISHDGTEVTTDFEELEWQIADGNVFQVRAWAPVPAWVDLTISDLVLLSSVDGEPRDIAPGGIYDPATGQEIPVNAPPSAVFPEVGEGRIVDVVTLTGSAKFLEVSVMPEADGWFAFNVTNPLAEQGQHFMVQATPGAGWNVNGAPNPESVDGAKSTNFRMQFTVDEDATIVEPMRFDLMTDIGGLQSWYAFLGANGVEVVNDESMATAGSIEQPAQDTPGLPLVWIGLVMVAFAARRRS